MLFALIYGFFSSGSPFETRNKRFDETRVNHLRNIKYAIDAYYQKNSKLPEKLIDLTKDYYYSDQTKDPQTNNDYEYQITSVTNYNLCAKFSTDSTKNNKNNPNYITPISTTDNPSFDHPAGYHCFELKLSQ